MAAGAYLSLTPRGGNEYVLVGGVWVVLAQDWGNAVWEHQFAGRRGTQGALPAQGDVANRTVRLQLRCYGVSQDDAAARLAELDVVVDALRRVGGVITRRAYGQTHRQYMEVLTTGGMVLGEEDKKADMLATRVVTVELICAPYALGDPMGWAEQADAMLHTIARVDGAGEPSMAGELLTVSATGAHLLVDDSRRYEYGDVRVASYLYPGSSASGNRRWGVLLRYVDPANWLAATVEQASGSGYVRLRSCIAGSETVLASTTLQESLTAPAHTLEGGWIVARIEGARLQAQWARSDERPAHPWAPTSYSNAWDVAAESVTATLAPGSTERDTWGPGTLGRVGLYAVPQAASVGGWMRWEVAPFAMTGDGSPQTHRNATRLRGVIPGTAPALAEVTMTRSDDSSSVTPFGLVGWARRRRGWNRCDSGDFGACQGWHSAAGWNGRTTNNIAGFVETLTFSGLSATHRVGVVSLTLRTVDKSGIWTSLAGAFDAGRAYRVEMQARRVSGAPKVRAVLGTSGDHALSAAVTLTDTWTTLEAVWAPTADVFGGDPGPVVAIRSDGTAGGVFELRRVRVWDVDDAPPPEDARPGWPPLAVIPWGYTTTDEGYDQSGFAVVGGNGSHTPGQTASGISAIHPSAHHRASVSGAGNLEMSCLIDPSVTDPDDYSGGRLDMEVWIRVALSATLVGPRVAVWSTHPGTPNNSEQAGIGHHRFAAPWGGAGMPLAPSTYWRLVRVGIVPVDIDPEHPGPARVSMRLSYGDGSTGSVSVSGIVVVPARSRALTPTGVSPTMGEYPGLLPAVTGNHVAMKRIGPDLSAQVRSGTNTRWVGNAGLGGSLLEIPSGDDIDVLLLAADQVPGDPAPPAANIDHSTLIEVQITPTPRWGHLRDL